MGLIGKFLTGVSQVAVPAALEEHRARIQAKRDATLHGYSKESAGEERTFRSDEAKTGRDFTAAEAVKERDFRSAEAKTGRDFTAAEAVKERDFRSAEAKTARDFAGGQAEEDRKLKRTDMSDTRAYREKSLEIEGERVGIAKAEQEAGATARTEQLKIAREGMESTTSGQKLVNEINQLKLDQAKDVEKALEIIKSTTTTQEEREAAYDYFYLLNPGKVVVKQRQGQDGEYLDEFAVFVNGRRVDTGAGPGSGGKDARMNEVKAKFQRGEMSRDEAARQLDAIENE